MTDRFSRRDVVFLVVAAALVILYAVRAGGGFPLDDSWIHQVYGRNLAQTGEWAFVPGVPSAASTSPLYTVLLSVGYRLNIPFQIWTLGLGIVSLWIAGMLAARLAERLLPGQKTVGWLTGGLLMLAWHLIWAAASGMETILFSMWTLALIAFSWHQVDHQPSEALIAGRVRGGALFGVIGALATLTRPEGVMLVGLIGLIMLLARPQGSWRGFGVWAISAGIAFVIVLAPYLVLNLRLTGGLLPDTAAAKQAEAADFLAQPFSTRLINMLVALFGGAQIALIPGILFSIVVMFGQARADRRRWFDMLPVAWVIGLPVLYAFRLPAAYQHGRYVIPALPALIVVGSVGTMLLLRRGQRSVIGRVLTRSLAIATIFAFIVFGLVIGLNQYVRDVTIINEEMVASAHWIADHIPPDQLLAVHDIGAVGYFAPRPILDLAGLVSPEIVPFIKDSDRLWQWLQARDARYLMGFPDQLPGHTVDDPRLCPVFTTGGTAAKTAGGDNMAIYELNWDGNCPQN